MVNQIASKGDKMKKLIFILMVGSLFVGCANMKSIQQIQAQNRTNLNLISLGDSKEKVFQIVGTETFNNVVDGTVSGTTINNPYKTETLVENGKTYEVVFYYTQTLKNDRVITNDELTPIVFYEGKVVGYGWLFVKDNIQRYQVDIRN